MADVVSRVCDLCGKPATARWVLTPETGVAKMVDLCGADAKPFAAAYDKGVRPEVPKKGHSYNRFKKTPLPPELMR